MNKEIELKARVNKPEALALRLEGLYGKAEDISKDDIYYLYGKTGGMAGEQPVRLRSENGKHIVTLKRKTVKNGVEMNDELEFGVDDQSNFLRFLQLTGAEEWLVKTKRGFKYSASINGFNAVIELCEVSTLGWFLEIEIVLKSPDDEAVSEVQEALYGILSSAGLSEKDIEPRYYSEMLR